MPNVAETVSMHDTCLCQCFFRIEFLLGLAIA